MVALAIMAELKTRPEACAEFEAILSELAAAVAGEAGNLLYSVGRSQKDPCVFRIF